jgi:hypothetical protein
MKEEEAEEVEEGDARGGRTFLSPLSVMVS